MLNDELRIEDEPRLEEVAALDDRLDGHNVVATGCNAGRWRTVRSRVYKCQTCGKEITQRTA
jgi:hypothetical protein